MRARAMVGAAQGAPAYFEFEVIFPEPRRKRASWRLVSRCQGVDVSGAACQRPLRLRSPSPGFYTLVYQFLNYGIVRKMCFPVLSSYNFNQEAQLEVRLGLYCIGK